MRFSDADLANIASWTPVCSGFDRDERTIAENIEPVLARIATDNRLAIRRMQDGGMSNYFSFLVFASCEQHASSIAPKREVACVAVMLSLMAPVGVFGHSTFSEGPAFFAYPNFEPEQVCDPLAPEDWMSASIVQAVHKTSPYKLIGRDETDKPLPAGVEVLDYCLCAKPWNRIFHALFADTD